MTKNQQLIVPHEARYHTLHLPSILNLATDFYIAKKDKATQGSMVNLAVLQDGAVSAWGLDGPVCAKETV